MIASAVDLVGLGILAAMLPISAVIQAVAWWRRRDVWELEELSTLALPLLLVLVAMVITGQQGLEPGYSMILTLQWCGYLGLFAVVLTTPRRWIIRAVLIVGSLLAVASLAEVLVTADRARWISGNPNIQAAWLLPMPFLVDLRPGKALMGSALLATGSRGGILAAAVAFCAQKGVNWRYLLLAGLLAAVGLWGLRPETVANRFGTWREAVGLWAQKPLLGWGPGCYTLLARNELQHPHADNLLLTVAAEQGLVGLAAWIWLIVAAGQLAVQSQDPARFSLLAIGVHQLFDNTLFWPWPGIMLMICLALVARGDYARHIDPSDPHEALPRSAEAGSAGA